MDNILGGQNNQAARIFGLMTKHRHYCPPDCCWCFSVTSSLEIFTTFTIFTTDSFNMMISWYHHVEDLPIFHWLRCRPAALSFTSLITFIRLKKSQIPLLPSFVSPLLCVFAKNWIWFLNAEESNLHRNQNIPRILKMFLWFSPFCSEWWKGSPLIDE